MKSLLAVSALIEGSTGVGLLVSPATLAAILFETGLETGVTATVCRIAGAALFSLAVACGMGRRDVPSRASSGLVLSLLFYNIAAVIILAQAGISARSGPGLWPAVALHIVMTGWCFVALARHRESTPA